MLHGVQGNRSAIIRIPAHYKGQKFANMKRIEFRAPDPSCNPYLAFSAIVVCWTRRNQEEKTNWRPC